MTCIVALKHKGKVYIGGDSLGSEGNGMTKVVRRDEKVFIKHDMLFGFTSSFRMGQILRYAFQVPERSENSSDMEYLVGVFIPALIDCYTEQGFLKKTEAEDVEGGEFLIGYRGNIYCVESDFQVGIPYLDYDAVGCGGDFAKGAMFAITKTNKSLTPEKKITMALEAATEHSAGCAPPYVILSV